MNALKNNAMDTKNTKADEQIIKDQNYHHH